MVVDVWPPQGTTIMVMMLFVVVHDEQTKGPLGINFIAQEDYFSTLNNSKIIVFSN